MPATVRGLLLTFLSLLDFIAWIASPLGWLTISWLTFYYVMTGTTIYASMVAIAFSGLFALMTAMLLFGPDLDVEQD